MIRTVIDQFGGCVYERRNAICSELLRRSRVSDPNGVIVDGCGVDVRHLLVEVPLGSPDVPDALQQFLEVAGSPFLQSLIIDGKAFLYVLMQSLCRPTTESRGHWRLDSIADCYDNVEIVVIYVAFDLSVAFFANY